MMTRLPRPTPTLLLMLCMASVLAACGGADTGDGRQADERMEGRTLAAPPDPQVGEWWTVEVDPELVGALFQTTLVVTRRDDGKAVIGIPPGDFSHDFLVLHIPVLGNLDLGTFAWRVMWDDFEALRFPLELGRSWTADFHGRDVEAEVTRVEGSRAHVTMTGARESIELVYDADVGMITDFREEALKLAFRVTGHGFDYAGDVLELSGIELALMQMGPSDVAAHHGADRETPAGGTASTGEAGRSSVTLEVDTDGSHGSLSLVAWNVGFEDAPGSYQITATAPDGTTFEKTFELVAGAPSVSVQSFGHDAVQGSWQLEFHRGGPAGLLVELFTYDLREVRLGDR